MAPELVATVLAGIAQGVRKAAPDESMPAGPAAGETFTATSVGGQYVVPSYDNGGKPTPVPLVEPAFEIEDEMLDYPNIEDIRRSPEMVRYFGLRDRHRRLQPKSRPLPRFAPLRSDQVMAMDRVHDELRRLSELDWTTFERWVDPAGMPGNWHEAASHVDRFLRSAERTRAMLAEVAVNRELRAAHTRVSPARETDAVSRLAGLGALFQSIKDYEQAPSGAGSKEFRFELEQRKQAAKNRMLGALDTANFATVAEFDEAVRALRRVVRERAVVVALTTMKESERVLQKEFHRYREPEVLNKLATAVATMLDQPPPYEKAVEKLATEYPILQDDVALRAALDVRNPDILRDVLLQNAQAQLDNIAKCRADLDKEPEHVFGLNRVVDETLKQLGLPPTAVQAVLIREQRAAPRNAVREVIDKLLFVLAFAWGPFALVGYVARAASLILKIHDARERSREKGRRETAAHTGRALADPPLPDSQILELLGLFLATTGVVPRVPTTLLPGRVQLAGGAAPVSGTVVGFRLGTRFERAAPGKIAIWHPDYPDELGILLPDRWVTRYQVVGGVPRQVGRWRLAEKEATEVGALVGNAPKALPAPQAVSAPAASSGFGSLGAMARLSPDTQAAEKWLEHFINNLIARTQLTATAFGRFASGNRRDVLVRRAEELEKRLQEHLRALLPERFRAHFPMDAEKRAVIAQLDRQLHAAVDQVTRLERLTKPVPFPNPAEQAVINHYVCQLAVLRQHQQDVGSGVAGAVARRDAVRDELIALEQRAARHNPGEEALLPHLESLARDRRRMLGPAGVSSTVAGLRSAERAVTIAPGGLANRTYAQIRAELGEPSRIELPSGARTPGATRAPLTGATRIIWVYKDGSTIRIDVPGPGARPFESGSRPHLARVGRDGTHYDDQGIAVPPDSTPAHLPVADDPSLQAAINRARH